jgi:parallel beta-helix repeat protein
VSDIEIIGGSYHDNGKEGILVKLSEQITITDVDIYNNKRQGVKIEGSTDVTVQDSRISNNSQELDGKYDEINIRERFDDDYSQNTYYSHNTQILNNQISSTGDVNARYGVREEPTNDDAGSTGTYVSGNTISGMDSGDISVPGYIWSGDAGDNAIAGTEDADTMAGGAGNDEYTVNHSGDLVTENAGEGTDHVYSSITYTLTPNVENLTLTGTGAINGYGNGLNNWIVGNAAVNTLKSDDGDDTLDGGGGADSLDGGNGNDTYYVDDAADVIVEKDSLGLGGYDHVFSSVSYVLSAQ